MTAISSVILRCIKFYEYVDRPMTFFEIYNHLKSRDFDFKKEEILSLLKINKQQLINKYKQNKFKN